MEKKKLDIATLVRIYGEDAVRDPAMVRMLRAHEAVIEEYRETFERLAKS